MLNGRGILATATIVAAIAAGCADSGRRVAMRPTHDEHLLFNPSWTGLPTLNSPRSQWPATGRYEFGAEVFDYKETIIDVENAFGASPDRYYRRFQAVRTGHGY